MCGHDDEILERNTAHFIRTNRPRAIDKETRDLATADRLLAEAWDKLTHFIGEASIAKEMDTETFSETIILANAINNFMRRDEPGS